MWQYLVYFLAGGVLVAAAAYVGNHYGGRLAAVVTSVPVVFLLSLALTYRSSGVGASLEYVKATLMLLPVFIAYALVTAWLLPRMNSLAALLPGLLLYLVPVHTTRRRPARSSVQQLSRPPEQPGEPKHGETTSEQSGPSN